MLAAAQYRKDFAASMSETTKISREAGQHFRSAADLAFEDARSERLRYHLLRLTVVGLTKDDVQDLGELARLAFQESDVTEHVSKIKQRADASSLAFAIADILERAGSGGRGTVSLKAAMFGAVLGAYTSLDDNPDVDKSAVAVLGAVGGAVATSTSAFIVDNINQQSWGEYLRMQE